MIMCKIYALRLLLLFALLLNFQLSARSEAKPSWTDYEKAAETLIERHKYRKAINALTKAIESQPRNSMLYVSRGLAYQLLHDHKNAIADNTQAMELMPDNYLAFLNRGASYLDAHNMVAAVSDFKRASEIRPLAPEPYLNLGILFSQEHDTENAKMNLQKALELYEKRSDTAGIKQTQKKIKQLTGQ